MSSTKPCDAGREDSPRAKDRQTRPAANSLLPPCILQMFGVGGGPRSSEFELSVDRTHELKEANAAGRRLSRDLASATREKKAVQTAVANALSQLRLLQINHSTLRNSLGLSPVLNVQAIGSGDVHGVASFGSWGADAEKGSAAALKKGADDDLLQTAVALHGGLKEMQESTVDLLQSINRTENVPFAALRRQLEESMATGTALKLQLVRAEASSASAAQRLEESLAETEELKASLSQAQYERDVATSHAMRAEEALSNLTAEAHKVEKEAAAMRRSMEGSAAVEVLEALPAEDPLSTAGLQQPQLSLAEKSLNEKLKLKAYILRLEAELGGTKAWADRLSRGNAILEAQIEQLEETLHHLSEDRANRLLNLQDDLAHVCGWAREVENDCARLEQDYAFLESFVPEEAKDQIMSSLRASGWLVSSGTTPTQSQTGSPRQRKSLDAASPFVQTKLEGVQEAGNASSDGASQAHDKVACSRELSKFTRSSSTPQNAKPKVPRLNLRTPMPTKALETSNFRRPIGERAGNSRRRGNPPRLPLPASEGSSPPSSPMSAKTVEYQPDSAPATCREEREVSEAAQPGFLGRSCSYNYGDSEQADKWVIHLEELHLNVQKRAHEVLLQRLESAVERLGAAECSLADKDKELTELRALVNPPPQLNKRKAALTP